MVFEAKITKQCEVAKGTHEVSFERPTGFEFKSGQHIQIAVEKLNQSDPKGGSRLFSIASSPQDIENICIIFRISGSGFKETLRMLPIGSIVKLEQASGSFLLPQKATRPQVFIAGGVGIAPFMSFLHQNIQDQWNQPVSMIYGNQNPQSAAYLQELKQMVAQQKEFSLEEIYKKPTVELFIKLTRKHKNAIWWVVGPPAMVAITVNGLQAGGILSEHIQTESFDGY